MLNVSWYEVLHKAIVGIVGRRRGGDARATDARTHEDRRCDPRLRIDTSAPFDMRPQLNIDEQIFDVFDLSTRGMCFALPAGGSGFEVGQVFSASVKFSGVDVPVELQVVNLRGRFVGCQITDAPLIWLMEVSKVIDPDLIGRMLEEAELDPDTKAAAGDLELTWFDGGPACDFLVWKHPDGTVERAQMTFMWHIVEWSREYGLRSGKTDGLFRASSNGHFFIPPTCAMLAGNESEAASFARRVLAASTVDPLICALFGVDFSKDSDNRETNSTQRAAETSATMPVVASSQRASGTTQKNDHGAAESTCGGESDSRPESQSI